MNRKTAKLLREFCYVENKPYRTMKKAWHAMDDKTRAKTFREMFKLSVINRHLGKLPKKYQDLKPKFEPKKSPQQILNEKIDELKKGAPDES